MQRPNVSLLYALALLTAALIEKADAAAVTDTVVTNRTTSNMESSTETHSELQTRRFQRLDKTEERTSPFASSISSLSKPLTESMRPMIKTTTRSFATVPMTKSSFKLLVRSMRSPIKKNSLRARYWLWRKETVDSVFKRLGLDKGLEETLFSPKFKAWVTFVDLVNLHNPDNKVSIARVLSETYTDLELARSIEASFSRRNKRPLVARLEKEQMENWEHDGKSINDVCMLLKLNVKGGNIFDRPEMNRWYLYAAKTNKVHYVTSIIEALSRMHGWEKLRRMAHTAKPQRFRMQDKIVTLRSKIDWWYQHKDSF
uniref:RxLR effector candidate protein n=1 Tax=Peronospora matthiolae TaxID=2874970 RepID=A0AAV1UNZ1_9STRA